MLLYFLIPAALGMRFFQVDSTKALLHVAGVIHRHNPMLLVANFVVSMVWVGFAVIWLEMWREYKIQ